VHPTPPLISLRQQPVAKECQDKISNAESWLHQCQDDGRPQTRAKGTKFRLFRPTFYAFLLRFWTAALLVCFSCCDLEHLLGIGTIQIGLGSKKPPVLS
jgi:hypothetical protein